MGDKSAEISDQPAPGPSKTELTIKETNSYLVSKNIPKWDVQVGTCDAGTKADLQYLMIP